MKLVIKANAGISANGRYYDLIDDNTQTESIRILRDEGYSNNEIFDGIVNYEGGLASGWEIRNLIESVYNVKVDIIAMKS